MKVLRALVPVVLAVLVGIACEQETDVDDQGTTPDGGTKIEVTAPTPATPAGGEVSTATVVTTETVTTEPPVTAPSPATTAPATTTGPVSMTTPGEQPGSLQTNAAAPVVVLDTNLGTIEIQLDPQRAPISTENFLQYAKSGFYDGTIFHRVIPGFMVQGGGYSDALEPKKTREPIRNEGENGLKNARGTVAMARTSDPNSATSQFFINVVDNPSLDAQPGQPGYAVFGKVTAGMEVADKISKVPAMEATTPKGQMANVPSDPVIIEKVTIKGEAVEGAQVTAPAAETTTATEQATAAEETTATKKAAKPKKSATKKTTRKQQ